MQLSALTEQYRAEQEMLDYRAALVCSIIAEVNRDSKRRHRPFQPSDFMPRREPRRRMTGEQMLESARIITQALGGETR